jgi:hypothetical protein
MAKLAGTSEVMIQISFLVRNLESTSSPRWILVGYFLGGRAGWSLGRTDWWPRGMRISVTGVVVAVLQPEGREFPNWPLDGERMLRNAFFSKP